MSHPLVAAARVGDSDRAGRLLALIAPELAATERLIEERLSSNVPFLEHSARYLAANGGKRMRPALLLLIAKALGRTGGEFVTYGAVVEFIHTATLVHDDIIDHAELRRGQRTPNDVWGNSLTVLLGDWIYTSAMKLALAHDDIAVIDRLCGATLRMTEGEMWTLARLGAADVTVDEYFAIIDRKTAELFAAACEVPAIARPGRAELVAALGRFGRSLGICFQLVDDLLDYTGNEREIGKPVLADLKEGKLTLPLILALPRLSPKERAKIESVLADRGFARVHAREILELVEREGTVDEVLESAERHAAAAREALASLPPGEARSALELAPDYVLHRRS